MRGIDLYKENDKPMPVAPTNDEGYTLVLKIAKFFKRKLPSHIELNDLIQSGYLGLLEAKKNFKDNQGATFETFASHRIKGAMIDELRKNSWGTRESLKQLKTMSEAVSRVEQRLQKQATPEEVADELQISPEAYLKASEKIAMAQVLSMTILEEVNALPGNEEDPSAIAEDEDMQAALKRVIQTLPKRDQQILSLYYVEELTLKEIAEVFNLTEARICQLHATLLARVKSKLVMARAVVPA